MTSLEDINDPTEAMNAALILFAKAFQLTAPTNNNQRTLSNPHNRQIAQQPTTPINLTESFLLFTPAERIAKSHDPLALMAYSQNSFNFPTTHKDRSSFSTHPQQSFPINNKYKPQPSWNQNFMQPPMTSLEDINDPTKATNVTLILFAKAFQLTAPTNNNQRTSFNPCNRQIAQSNGGIQGTQNAGQNAGVQSGRNQNGLLVVPGIANQNENGNAVAARDEGIQLQAEEFKFMAAAGDLDEIEEVNANCILIENLQHTSTSDTQLDKAPVYDTDGSAKYTDLLEPIPEPQLVLQNDNHVTYVAPIMVQSEGIVEISFAPNEETRAHQETVYHNLVDQVAQKNKCFTFKNDEISNLNKLLSKEKLSISSLMEEKKKLKHDFKTREVKFLDKEVDLEARIKDLENILLKKEHDPPVAYDSEETLELAQESRERMRFLKKEIKPANYAKINHLLGDLSDDTTPSVAQKFLNEVKSSLVTLQRVVKQKMTLEVHNWSSSAHKEVHRTISHEISPIINQVDARVKNFEIQFLQEAAKFVQDFKSLTKEADESLDKKKSLELKIE
nr:hypothetical protein [Tanacetum cinerariifolium]